MKQEKEVKKPSLQFEIRKNYNMLSALSLLFISFLITFSGINFYWRDVSSMCEQAVQMNHDLIHSRLTEVRNNQEILAKSSSTREMAAYYLETGGEDPKVNLAFQHQIRGAFYLLSRNFSINSVYLVSREGDLYYSCREMPRENATLKDEEWFRKIVDRMYKDECEISELHERPYMITNNANHVISMVRPILAENSLQFRPLGYIIFDIDISQFLLKSEKDVVQFVMLDKNGNMEHAPTFSVDSYTENALREVSQDRKRMTRTVYGMFHLPESMLVRSTLDTFDITLIGIRSFPGMKQMAVIYLCLVAGILVFALFLTSWLSRRISNSILKPMNRLVSECNEIASGELMTEFSEKESEEISFLSETIENMVRNLSELTEQVATEKIRLSEEKVRVLQHQINPHFINNTLQAMKALSLEGESEKVSRIATLLGRFLSYSVYEPFQNVSLETETQYVKNYIELQNVRYDGRILFNCELDEGTEELKVPKMTLQPMVENCVLHGLSNEGTLTVNISAEKDSKGISIVIYDDGGGIPEDKLAELRRDMENETVYTHSSSIGILNVNERLKRVFGDAYSMDIRSHPGTGTAIVLNLPDVPEKGASNESTDRG